ncbi:hypothetical protein F2Q70_00016015 [Brassica cretica]|uniref:Uncharacterized protein n=1 Tax=Brassica cretica TaxID=69181 RepID=A0A8S9I2E7_BRACR|nr:hypothetical protein F2Q70_00016015 [Brassica cretica]KAF2595862.1 hypothetical protein F2Q68_00008940 [Brassica cretica]
MFAVHRVNSQRTRPINKERAREKVLANLKLVIYHVRVRWIKGSLVRTRHGHSDLYPNLTEVGRSVRIRLVLNNQSGFILNAEEMQEAVVVVETTTAKLFDSRSIIKYTNSDTLSDELDDVNVATSLGPGNEAIHYNLKYKDIAPLSLTHKPQAGLLGLKGPATKDLLKDS